MYAAHARRLLPHVLAHPRDKQAAGLLTKTLSYTGHGGYFSPLYAASAGLHETASWPQLIRSAQKLRTI